MSSLSTLYAFPRLIPLSHKLIKDKLLDLVERSFLRENSFFLACNEKHALFTSEDHKHYTSSCGLVRKFVCGLVRKFVWCLHLFLIVALFGLVLNYTNCWYTYGHKLSPFPTPPPPTTTRPPPPNPPSYCTSVPVLLRNSLRLSLSHDNQATINRSIQPNVSIFG